MPPRPPEDACPCFGWGSEYMTTSGHHIRCEERIAKPDDLSRLIRDTHRDIQAHWIAQGASRVEALESAHYVISNIKQDLQVALSHARGNQ